MVLIAIKGIGCPPAFKNGKMLTRGKLITHPQKQEWMRAAERIIASQLLSKYPRAEGETVTAQKLRSWIAYATPKTDSCEHLIACSWRFMKLPAGSPEGALILIQREENHKPMEKSHDHTDEIIRQQ